MARSKNGNPQDASGKIANLVYYKLNGQWVVRTIGVRKKPFTPAEIANQEKYRIVNTLLSDVGKMYQVGFERAAKGTVNNAHNLAFKKNLKAVEGVYPNQYINFSKVAISKGKMPIVENAKVTYRDGHLDFTWDTEWSVEKKQFYDDQVMLMAYYPSDGQTFHEKAGDKRAEGKASLALSPYPGKDTIVHVYLSFISNDRKRISNSIYMGAVDISGQ